MTETKRALSRSDKTTFRGILVNTQQSSPWMFSWFCARSEIPLDVLFIHIPKTAGESAMTGARAHLLRCQTLRGNEEHPYLHTNTNQQLDAEPNHKLSFVLLRDPAAHLLSQFLECKYDAWGKQVTKGTEFPGYDTTDKVMDGFDDWVAHFASSPGRFEANGMYAFRCYDPWNLQTRFMAANTTYTVHYHRSEATLRPSLENARANLRGAKLLVGITEHFAASMCLLEHRASGGGLTRACRTCDPEAHTLATKMNRETHGVPPHSFDMVTNETTLRHVRTLTELDQQLYDYALTIFHEEIDSVYNETGIDLLCREKVNNTTTSGLQPIRDIILSNEIRTTEVFFWLGFILTAATLLFALTSKQGRCPSKSSSKQRVLNAVNKSDNPIDPTESVKLI